MLFINISHPPTSGHMVGLYFPIPLKLGMVICLALSKEMSRNQHIISYLPCSFPPVRFALFHTIEALTAFTFNFPE